MILNEIGQRWSNKKEEKDYPADSEQTLKVRPREQFVKQMLAEHEKFVDSSRAYTTAMVYPATFALVSTVAPISDLQYRFEDGKITEVRRGYGGAVRTQYERGKS